MLTHWDALSGLSQKRFSDANLADEALLFVSSELERNNWKRLHAFKGKSSFRTYLLHVAARLMEDFARKKFGRVRPNRWVNERGGIWLHLFRLICRERMETERAIDVLRHTAPGGRSAKHIRKAITTLRINVPDCGKNTLPQQSKGMAVEEIPDTSRSQHTARPDSQIEEQQRTAVLTVISTLVEATDAPDKRQLSPLADKLFTASRSIQLNTEDRLLLKLVYWDGINISAAGRMLDMTATRAHNRMRKIQTNIRNALQTDAIYDDLKEIICDP